MFPLMRLSPAVMWDISSELILDRHKKRPRRIVRRGRSSGCCHHRPDLCYESSGLCLNRQADQLCWCAAAGLVGTQVGSSRPAPGRRHSLGLVGARARVWGCGKATGPVTAGGWRSRARRVGWQDGGGPGRGRPGGETVAGRGEAGRVARRWRAGARPDR